MKNIEYKTGIVIIRLVVRSRLLFGSRLKLKMPKEQNTTDEKKAWQKVCALDNDEQSLTSY